MLKSFVLTLLLIFSPSAIAQDFRPIPEIATGFSAQKSVTGQKVMAVTANPNATRAAYDILSRGGSVVDAAIAAQAVLGLVEPQSSGLGGGAFALYYNAADKKIFSYDGRETAPANATQDMFIKSDGATMDFYDAVLSGKSIGVPGTPRLLEVMHNLHGMLPWGGLFEQASFMAENGFEVSPRLAKMVKAEVDAGRNTKDFDSYFKIKGKYIKAGDVLKNKKYAQTLKLLAVGGSRFFYEQELAKEIVNVSKREGGSLNPRDLSAYRVRIRVPACGEYRRYVVCSMGEPSSGGSTILQALGMIQTFPLDEWGKDDPRSWHIIAEASRLAFADRNYYIGDPDFVETPGDALYDKEYVKKRAEEINMVYANPLASNGRPAKEEGTSHMSFVDQYGNVLSMTSTIESAFGSHHMAGGFFLNNEMTDFDFTPYRDDGELSPNRVQGGKRPRSSMSPTIVFDDKEPFLVVGSAGGSRIIGYVMQRIISIIDWEQSLKDAVDAKNILSRGPELEVENGTDGLLLSGLRARNQIIEEGEQTSGITAILFHNDSIEGYADPRREGIASGE